MLKIILTFFKLFDFFVVEFIFFFYSILYIFFQIFFIIYILTLNILLYLILNLIYTNVNLKFKKIKNRQTSLIISRLEIIITHNFNLTRQLIMTFTDLVNIKPIIQIINQKYFQINLLTLEIRLLNYTLINNNFLNSCIDIQENFYNNTYKNLIPKNYDVSTINESINFKQVFNETNKQKIISENGETQKLTLV